jgi:NTP pyrophosphatase (non-canonical NTP hydrolase)
MPVETQYTITAWADKTFGHSRSILRSVKRADEEMRELITALKESDNTKAAEEIADIFIVLYRSADMLHVDIHEVIDKKMEINRQREWLLDGTGHGYHK